MKFRDNFFLLASEAGFKQIAARLIEPLSDTYEARAMTSTQEQAWLILAANALGRQPTGVTVSTPTDKTPMPLHRLRLDAGSLNSNGPTITNTTNVALPIVLTTIGSTAEPLPAAEEGFELTRRYYRLDGTPLMPENGAISVAQNERLVVVVSGLSQRKSGRILLVDRFAAGLEIENPKLVEGGTLSGLAWLTTPIQPVHTEFRDDRFVAAFDAANVSGSESRREYTVAYMVRAVTPGDYLTPAAQIEDMYRPERFARTDTVRLSVKAGN